MKRLPFHRNQNIMNRYPYHNDIMFLIYHKNSDLTFLFQPIMGKKSTKKQSLTRTDYDNLLIRLKDKNLIH